MQGKKNREQKYNTMWLWWEEDVYYKGIFFYGIIQSQCNDFWDKE